MVDMSDSAKECVAKVRVTRPTLAAWKRAAKTSGMTLSDWIRRRVDGVQNIEVAQPKAG